MRNLFLILTLLFAIPTKSDMLYFWLENEDFAADNLLSDENYTFEAFVSFNDDKEKLGVSVAQGNGYWSYNSETKKWDYLREDLTPGDFGHRSENYTAAGDYRKVYAIDTGSYTINKNDSVEYMFSLELDALNGTHYSAEIMESEIWDKDDRWMWPYKDHVCSGVHLNEYSVPEPNSMILMLIGGSLLALRRRKFCIG